MSDPLRPDAVVDAPFAETLAERYLVYALSTITARSLPDVRDGLKPVHRRLLWAMRLLRLSPDQAFKKCARVVGDVIGRYHPHGDQAVYDALVRLAQDFALRYPLIEGQGNFGSIDGDGAAAMRYTEARLTRAAMLMMDGVDEATVPFRPTYNGEEEEPEVLPAAFPNLLANGAQGIAVGMATAIPPHNLAELVAAADRLLENPDATVAELVALVPGPDLPTGGVIVEPLAARIEAYATGRGAFRLRARWQVEEQGRGTWVAVVTEIPFGVPKARLVEQIAALLADRKLPLVDDLHDESDAAVRLVIVPRARSVPPEALMESLFRQSDLEIRLPLNLNVLDAQRTPRVMSLKEALLAWLEHRRIVLTRRAGHRLARIADRLEIVDGYLRAFLDLDEVIRTIREEDDPAPVLMARFALSERQAEAILNLRLRALRRLEEEELVQERTRLLDERARLEALLASPAEQTQALRAELAGLAADYGPTTPLGRRRTDFADTPPPVDAIRVEAVVPREPLTVILSAKGWIRSARGHADLSHPSQLRFKEGDELFAWFHAHTTDRILVLSSGGRSFALAAHALPGGRGFGEALSLLVDWPAGEAVAAALPFRPGQLLLLAASDGRGFLAPADALLAETRKGRQVMSLKAGARLLVVRPVADTHDHAAFIGQNRKLLVVPLAEIPRQERGQGVILQRYRDGGLADATTLHWADGLSWPLGGATGRIRTEADLSPWRGARGTAGRMAPAGFPRDNRFRAPSAA
ncbi:MAG: DNA topoisomerase IV subunit A [Sphingomonadaceae bacterium]|uniref:DNA topoisomerase IV subunit A n=1 Tax=Thermaurantiacus sp. TaxID=2820283 RepID=UPI00298EE1DC|nr:DNA topoisomerase IV subunit A [Thermaurantiacus sp.]MCS6987703.1 DNA topoisomerase IV subunit A [Sphingomonadaceae bacterium]MDW8415078.1 DNA topoisomerase IV subunit A [Thermaurantiacus sp.]